MTLLSQPFTALDGTPLPPETLAGKTVLVVNVASKCGLTPQYAGLERLQQQFGGDAFTVLGAPCNQFGGQEPGSAEEIQTFCAVNYGATFPLLEKLEVNGDGRHPLYAALVETPDAGGEAGDVQWNFEKFLVTPDGQITRFRPQTEPESDEIVGAIQSAIEG